MLKKVSFEIQRQYVASSPGAEQLIRARPTEVDNRSRPNPLLYHFQQSELWTIENEVSTTTSGKSYPHGKPLDYTTKLNRSLQSWQSVAFVKVLSYTSVNCAFILVSARTSQQDTGRNCVTVSICIESYSMYIISLQLFCDPVAFCLVFIFAGKPEAYLNLRSTQERSR